MSVCNIINGRLARGYTALMIIQGYRDVSGYLWLHTFIQGCTKFCRIVQA